MTVRTTFDELLTQARAALVRVEPHEARDAIGGGALLIDGGYQSSLAAATLQQLGFAHATDLVGGFRAWRAAGLPVASAA